MKKEKDVYQQAIEDMDDMVNSTTELIDMPFKGFAGFLEGKNIGTLKAYRTLMQRNLDEVDLLGKRLVESAVTTFNKEERVKLGSVFGLVSKIVERMGYIDLLIGKLAIKPTE